MSICWSKLREIKLYIQDPCEDLKQAIFGILHGCNELDNKLQ